MRAIDEITRACQAGLHPELSEQHIVSSMSPTLGTFAFEFRWTDGKLYKVVVSEAEEVGVENMEYPPPARKRSHAD